MIIFINTYWLSTSPGYVELKKAAAENSFFIALTCNSKKHTGVTNHLHIGLVQIRTEQYARQSHCAIILDRYCDRSHDFNVNGFCISFSPKIIDQYMV